MNIKGVFQIWMRNGDYHEVPLKECHAWTREGCKACPDFAAEHADISTGGIGAFADWTLTIVRTELGREILIKMLEDGSLIGRPGDDDPGAIALLRKLSVKSRKRWPATAVDAPGLIPRRRPNRPRPTPPSWAPGAAMALDVNDVGRADRIVLRGFDLPGAGWEAVPAPMSAAEVVHGDDLLDACLAGFPDPDVTASAESARFTRENALAYSVAWVLSSEAAAEIALATLAHERFATAFVTGMAAEVDPDTGAATLLGHVAGPVGGIDAADRSAAHRARLTAADADGILSIHLELLALQEERAVTLVILADSPDPMPPADVHAVAQRVAGRLSP